MGFLVSCCRFLTVDVLEQLLEFLMLDAELFLAHSALSLTNTAIGAENVATRKQSWRMLFVDGILAHGAGQVKFLLQTEIIVVHAFRDHCRDQWIFFLTHIGK